MDFGVNYTGGGYAARLYSPNARKCCIRLFKKGAEKPADTIEMLPAKGFAGIFECCFDTKADEYLFETDREVIVDPYSRQITGKSVFGDISGDKDGERCIRSKLVKKQLAPDFGFKSAGYEDLLIYKLHVRGFTIHESSGVAHPGTFKGVTEKVSYLKQLGVNAVLLMPCYEFDEEMEEGYGKTKKLNFWGYGADSYYFAPKSAYSSDTENPRREFFDMVKTLHKNGIAVFMEMDFGAGTSDVLMLEALRSWKSEYGIDGFRIIGRYALKRMFATDPYLKDVKLISDYWEDCILGSDVTDGQLAVCNDSFMICARKFLKGDEDQVRAFSEMVRRNSPKIAGINYLADHDGFTLADVYSYDERHNRGNGENNLDGREINYSWNCGAEGETRSRHVLSLRLRMIKNALCALFMSQGTPMLLAGDEFGLTHYGNNNPYCCDNIESWVVWEKTPRSKKILDFVRQLSALRRAHRVLSNRIELKGTDYIYSGCPDISFHGTRAWYPDFGYFSRTLGVLFNGDYALVDRKNKDSTYYIAFNMHWEEHEFDLPCENREKAEIVLSTDPLNRLDGERSCVIRPRSIAVFEMKRIPGKGSVKESVKESAKVSDPPCIIREENVS